MVLLSAIVALPQFGVPKSAKLIFLPAPPDVRSAHVEAVIRLAEPDLRTVTAWRVFGALAEAHGSTRHSRSTLLRLLNGRQPRVTVFPDHVRVSISAPMGGEENALSVLFGLLNEPIRDVNAYRDTEGSVRAELTPRGFARIWQTERDDRPMPYLEMVAHLRVAARPERVTICVQGRGPFDQVERAWRGFERDWPTVDRDARRLPAKPVPVTNAAEGRAIAWMGPERSASSTTLIDIAAAMALGAGKDATAFRIARTKLRLAYTPLVIWHPTPSGWRTVFWMDRSAGMTSDDQTALVNSVADDVSSWDVRRIAHVRGMLQVVFERQVAYSPLLSDEERTLGGEESDPAYWTAYWWAKTGELWDTANLSRLLAGVPPDALKASARRQLGIPAEEINASGPGGSDLIQRGKFEFRVIGKGLGMGDSAER
jgi:hypothetical protein